MSRMRFDCPQCGEPTNSLFDGYCAECSAANQSALDAHNDQHDRWKGLSDARREAEIKRAAQ